jgi:hypothetical protein
VDERKGQTAVQDILHTYIYMYVQAVIDGRARMFTYARCKTLDIDAGQSINRMRPSGMLQMSSQSELTTPNKYGKRAVGMRNPVRIRKTSKRERSM